MAFRHSSGGEAFRFEDLKTLLAKAGPLRSGDQLAGVAARSAIERMAARMALADVPLTAFLNEAVVPYESDDVTRLIVDTHDAEAFAPIRHLTVGGLRDWLLSEAFGGDRVGSDSVAPSALAMGLTPEMVAAVSKLMRNQDLILVARKIRVVTKFRTTVGLLGRMSVRLQPNHPTDDVGGIVASTIDGLMYGCGDAVIGINPASDSLANAIRLLKVLDEFRQRYEVPVQNCVLAHVTHLLRAMEMGAPVDLVFQSIGGTQGTNESFGVSLSLLDEAYAAALGLARGTVGENVMYFETGQGSALSAGANYGVDQQTCEVRAYAVARRYKPMLVNTVVGFIGPEYLYDAKQITRAGLEDHFCGKLMGLPMGCDVCYTNHAEADQDDMDNLLTLLGVAGVNFVMGVPGADDIMLNYQSTSFHDSLYVREVLGLKRAPEFEEWLLQGAGLRAQGSGRLGLEGQGSGRRAQGSERVMEELLLGAGSGRLLPQTMPTSGDETVRYGAPGLVGVREVGAGLKEWTSARVGLGQVGVSVPAAAALEFGMDHARARDAIHLPLDVEGLGEELRAAGFGVEVVESAAGSREEYLLRPDLGRRLSQGAGIRAQGSGEAEGSGVAGRLTVVVADGLSAVAPPRNAVGVLRALREMLVGWELDTVFLATGARVALGDEVGAMRGAEAVLVLIGERPGLQASDSLGAYLTYRPRVGCSDAERNCISNIRVGGLGFEEAAERLVRLLEGARRLGGTGVGLKDEGGLVGDGAGRGRKD